MGKKPTVVMRFYYMEWLDPHSHDEWISLDEAVKSETPRVIRSAGILLRETKDCYLLGVNHDVEIDHASVFMIIPKQFVIRKLELCLKNKKTQI